MSTPPLHGKRILVTQADVFMGPDLCAVLAEQGASVIADTQSMVEPEAPTAALADAGDIDVLVVNLAVPAPEHAGHRGVRCRMERHLRGAGASAAPAGARRIAGR